MPFPQRLSLPDEGLTEHVAMDIRVEPPGQVDSYLSFDSKMKPFLGYKVEWNSRIEKRKYFDRMPSLVERIGQIISDLDSINLINR